MCIFFSSRNGRQERYKNTDFESPSCIGTREEVAGAQVSASLSILLEVHWRENFPCFLCQQGENEPWTVMSYHEVVKKMVELLDEMVGDLSTKKNPGSDGEKTGAAVSDGVATASSSSYKIHNTLQQQQEQQVLYGATDPVQIGEATKYPARNPSQECDGSEGLGARGAQERADAGDGGARGSAAVSAQVHGDGGGAVIGARAHAAAAPPPLAAAAPPPGVAAALVAALAAPPPPAAAAAAAAVLPGNGGGNPKSKKRLGQRKRKKARERRNASQQVRCG